MKLTKLQGSEFAAWEARRMNVPRVDGREDPEQRVVGRLGVGGWLRAQGPGRGSVMEGAVSWAGGWDTQRCGAEWPAGVRVAGKPGAETVLTKDAHVRQLMKRKRQESWFKTHVCEEGVTEQPLSGSVLPGVTGQVLMGRGCFLL